MIYNFYDTCSLLMRAADLFDDVNEKIIISSVTLQELENIKTSINKDAEIKYNARKLLRILDENPNKYEVVIFKESMLEPIQQADLPINDDMRILACATYYDIKYHPDEVVFVTNDMSLFILSNLIFGNDSIEMVGYDQEPEYTGYMEKTLSDDELSYFYSNQNVNIYNLNKEMLQNNIITYEIILTKENN